MAGPAAAAALAAIGAQSVSDILQLSAPALRQLRAAATEALQLEDGSYWHARPQIWTLALATHPRLGAASLLRLLPFGVLRQIAGLLPRPRADPRWASPSVWSTVPVRALPSEYDDVTGEGDWPADRLSDDGRTVSFPDGLQGYGNLGNTNNALVPMLSLAKPLIGEGVCYVELHISESWCGSEINIGKQICFTSTAGDGEGGEDDEYALKVNDVLVPEWEGLWRNNDGSNMPYSLELGILVDFDRGICALRFRNINGPCIALAPGEVPEGVTIEMDGEYPDDLPEWTAVLTVPEKVPPGLCSYPQRYE